MAKLNGLHLKCLKKIRGREGEAYQGDLYLNNKKIAFWSQDCDGCLIDTLIMEQDFSEEKLRQQIKNIYADIEQKSDYELEHVLYDLVSLTILEKEVRKNAKKGYPVTVVVYSDYEFSCFGCKRKNADDTESDIKYYQEKHIKELEHEINKNATYSLQCQVFFDNSDFSFGKSVELEKIKRGNLTLQDITEEIRNDNKIENPTSSAGRLIVNVKGGSIVATISEDPQYPGIDVEFIPDHDDGSIVSNPRILMEKPQNEELRAVIWGNQNSEDFSNKIIFN